MGSRIVRGDRSVETFANNLPGAWIHDNCANRNLTEVGGLRSELQRTFHGIRSVRHDEGAFQDAERWYRALMRIVGGKFKGRALVAPDGRGTRPTSDRARETVFNILVHASWAPDLDGVRVIDLFAGSGALGFEAISRGAAFCLFVETDSAARGAIRTNADALQLFGITRIHRRSATDLGPKPAGVGAPFDLAFLDPPYGKDLVLPCLRTLADGAWLMPDALVVVETAADEGVLADGWDVIDTRETGAARLTFLRKAN